MTSRILIYIFLGTLLTPFFSYAEHNIKDKRQESSFGIEEWFTSGDAGWQISFPYSDLDSGGNGSGIIESELRFRHINGPVTIAHTSSTLNPAWKLYASIGFGSISGGSGSDTDRDNPAAGGVIVFSESTQDIYGDITRYTLDFSYRKTYSDNNQSPWGIMFGFLHYEDSLIITNGVQTISENGWWWDPYPNPPLGPFPNLYSTYDFSWNALKIGASYHHEFADCIYLTGSFSAYPLVQYQGEGYWNLRDMTFKHKATTGFGYESALGLRYLITDTTELSAGYRYFHLKAENGTDTTYFSGAYGGVANLDFAEVTRQGMYIGLLFRF